MLLRHATLSPNAVQGTDNNQLSLGCHIDWAQTEVQCFYHRFPRHHHLVNIQIWQHYISLDATYESTLASPVARIAKALRILLMNNST